MASQKLTELHVFLKDNAERLSKPPQTLDELCDSLTLLEMLQNDLTKIEARFPPLHEQFAILEKYDVSIPEETQKMLDDLSNEWVSFQQCLIDSDAMLKKYKEKFKSGVIASVEEFKKNVHNLYEDFHSNGIS
ncbi:dynein axonemal heavy chain 2-like [Ptychodera flava]|uniref:dynein axonemal heavy chain 2-like n=1 Tax=Ptychodera flava TaxID=63121 RepID=UPI00396A0F9C